MKQKKRFKKDEEVRTKKPKMKEKEPVWCDARKSEYFYVNSQGNLFPCAYIARDVMEDKKMNRQYIKPDFQNIVATLKLADMFYESSFSSIKNIPLKYRFAVVVARRLYRQIGRKILSKGNMENYEKSGKIYVNYFGKVFQTFLSLFDLMVLFLKNIEPHQRQREHEIISEDVNLDERI